jgi:hypothetical protein
MRTAIVSDLHLGHAFGEDLVRDPEIRRLLLEEISTADRVVLLGDILELRELPLATVLEAVRPFFEELGEALGGRPVVLVPGNHDHRLAEPLLEDLALDAKQLGLEQRQAPGAGPAALIEAWLGASPLEVAYPGIWLREDVYAIHGHYMDCHMALPRLECIAAAASMRAFGRIPDRARPADYERVLRPVYGLTFSLAQVGMAPQATRPSERAWRLVSGRNRADGRLRLAARSAAVGAGVPATVWALNRLLRADFDADLSPAAISRDGVTAATAMVGRLRIEAEHVIAGHTHRAGPREGEASWGPAGGPAVHNTGSWVFATAFHHPGTPPGPYWPGTVTWVDDDGPPRRAQLLIERPRDDLQATVERLTSRSE